MSELGWPSGKFRRVVNGLGWPRGHSVDVSRETESEASSSRSEGNGSPFSPRWIEESAAPDVVDIRTADVSAPPTAAVPATAPSSRVVTTARTSGGLATQTTPTVVSAPTDQNADTSPHTAEAPLVSSDTAASADGETPEEVPIDRGSPREEEVDGATTPEPSPRPPKPKAEIPTALAHASEALARELAVSSAPATPAAPPSTESRSVSVTRPWLEVEPNPAFASSLVSTDTAQPTSTGAAPSGGMPLVESISLMDESTPLAMEVAEDTRRRIALAGRRFPRPRHTRVMTVANQKGGVGKTTTTVNMAAALAQAGMRVLVLDIDPQGNASTALGIDHHSEVPSIYDVLVESRPLHEVVQACPDIENLWCAPATIDLAGAEIELVSLVARESRLKTAVTAYLQQAGDTPERLDYILIDCPPSLGLLTVNAFVAAKEVLIPIQCEYYALEGLSQLLRNVELIKGHLNPSLHVSTILLTMYDGRTRLSSQVADEVRAHFPAEVLRTTVPRSVRISEAPSHGQTVMTYDPASSGALSYLEAARELAEQVLSSDGDGRRRAEGQA